METAELERLEAAAAKARDAWSDKSDRLSTLHRELRDLEDKLARDYGPDDAFLALEVVSPRHAKLPFRGCQFCSQFCSALPVLLRVKKQKLRDLEDKLAMEHGPDDAYLALEVPFP